MEPLTEDQRILADCGTESAKTIARRYAKLFPPEHADDIESSATWGAVRAASTWASDKGERWERWLNLCVQGEIKDFLDSAYSRRRLREDRDLTIDCEEIVDESSDSGQGDTDEELDELLAHLPDRQRKLCGLVYRDGITPSEAGLALGITPSGGRQLHRASLAWLREKLSA